ncbi:glycerophosphodiester phosphodiesterase [Neomicrococcus aestuarii]|uniref:Glycerophosphodiester phosphodiesterase n=1 Tax=Neomicrococcus aestuarii TaxID=556325 RepID=A0A1L2ZN96_9MICC|nr:glycerophosphodiester phosphodiesterase family protein [Neomicrococcus aestuarii]APF40895.1 glycerophosphodiester phosphodiesterase [Neomicrococcus aestuarii]
MRTLFFAHRGSSATYAENTRAAYLHAIAEGADGVECDVHLSEDQEVVCHHDFELGRTSDGAGAVSSRTLEELRGFDYSSWKGKRIPDEYGARSAQLVTLSELIELCVAAGRPLGLAIELKHPSPYGRRLEERVLEVLMKHGWDPESSRIGEVWVSLMSFDPDSMLYLRESVPSEFLCQLVADVTEEAVEEVLAFGQLGRTAVTNVLTGALNRGIENIESGVVGIAGPGKEFVREHPEQVASWISSGRVLRVWTVDALADATYLTGLGVQQLTSNRPAALRDETGI